MKIHSVNGHCLKGGSMSDLEILVRLQKEMFMQLATWDSDDVIDYAYSANMSIESWLELINRAIGTGS